MCLPRFNILAPSLSFRVSPSLSSAGSSHLTETLLGCTVAPPVPEEPINPESALGCGYGESKWVAERILQTAEEKTPLRSVVIRVTQLCGGGNGAWNTTEWAPRIMLSAHALGCVPASNGVGR